MKIKTLLYISIIGLATLVSCNKDETKQSIASSPAIPVLNRTYNGNDLVWTGADTVSSNRLSFNWTNADYGLTNQLITYYVQLDFDTVATKFSAPILLGSGSTNSLQISTYSLNLSLLRLHIKNKVKVWVRVVSSLTGNASDTEAHGTYVSNEVSFTITPFVYSLNSPWPKTLLVVGDYQGWNNSSTNPAQLIARQDSVAGTYSGTINITTVNDGIKFIKTPGDWSSAYGDANVSGTTGVLVLGGSGNNIKPATPGTYLINVNLTGLRYTLVKQQ